MKLIFAGTPEFAGVILDALLSGGHEILAVYTQPDRPAGRGRKLTPGPVKCLALEKELLVRQPRRLTPEDEISDFRALKADAMVVAAYGLILPQGILSGTTHGCINVHASLLPRWRGASPIQHAILAGDTRTGISIMLMDAGLDTGPVLRQCPLTIDSCETGGSLHERLAHLGRDCLLRTLDDVRLNRARPQIQDEAEASYAPRINKAEARIDWHDDAECLERRVRAFNPWPVAYTLLPVTRHETSRQNAQSQVLRIHAAQAVATDAGIQAGEILQPDRKSLIIGCGKGALKLKEVQVAGRRRVPVADFLNAWPLDPGMRLA